MRHGAVQIMPHLFQVAQCRWVWMRAENVKLLCVTPRAPSPLKDLIYTGSNARRLSRIREVSVFLPITSTMLNEGSQAPAEGACLRLWRSRKQRDRADGGCSAPRQLLDAMNLCFKVFLKTRWTLLGDCRKEMNLCFKVFLKTRWTLLGDCRKAIVSATQHRNTHRHLQTTILVHCMLPLQATADLRFPST